MYAWSAIHTPARISREEFIRECFTYDKNTHRFGFPVLQPAVALADKFVAYVGPCKRNEYERTYSLELVGACYAIIAKLIVDASSETRTAVGVFQNLAVAKLEWQICELFDYNFEIRSELSELYDILGQTSQHMTWMTLLVYEMLQHKLTNLAAVLLACRLLRRKRKLRVDTAYRYAVMADLLSVVSNCYEVAFSDLLHELKQLTL